MTSEHRFLILMFALGLIAAGFGWAFKRFIDKQDVRWERVDRLILNDAASSGSATAAGQRLERLEAALVKLAETVANLGVAQSRHEGWHERQEELEVMRTRHHERDLDDDARTASRAAPPTR